jgi:two-component system chemotaxis response regulator CheY
MASETILVVEDNPIQREGVAAILQQQGYTVLPAADADEGLAWVRSEPPPDLVLLDMMTRAVKDGWYFLAQRSRVPSAASIPVIIVTDVGNASDGWACMLGARGLLRKPLEVDALLAQIRRCLGA